MKLGVYVGTFNPPHCGHMAIINHLLKERYVDRVIVIPTGSYWNKQNILAVEKRIKMLKHYEQENIIINDSLNDLPYTYQILEALKKQYKDELYLIIGSDNLYKFALWKNINEILNHRILVIPREDDDCEALISNFKEKKQFIIVNDFSQISVSSTQIRKLISEGKYDDVLKYLHPKVFAYIIDNNLYESKGFNNLLINKTLVKKRNG